MTTWGALTVIKVLATFKKNTSTIKIKNLLTYFDGKLDLISICDKLDLPIWDVKEEVKKLIDNDLIRKI